MSFLRAIRMRLNDPTGYGPTTLRRLRRAGGLGFTLAPAPPVITRNPSTGYTAPPIATMPSSPAQGAAVGGTSRGWDFANSVLNAATAAFIANQQASTGNPVYGVQGGNFGGGYITPQGQQQFQDENAIALSQSSGVQGRLNIPPWLIWAGVAVGAVLLLKKR